MIYKKIEDAIDLIKNSPLKKQGRNTYSEYDYYTPEQVNKLVYDACKKVGLFVRFDLLRNEHGIEGLVTVFDSTDFKVSVEYKMASDVPSIKATNIAQQLGGAMTYTKRYMLMNIFDIVDNNLDFDTTTNTKKQSEPKEEKEDPKEDLTPDGKPKQWLNRFAKDSETVLPGYITIIHEAKKKGLTEKDLSKYYKISKNVASYLETDFNNL